MVLHIIRNHRRLAKVKRLIRTGRDVNAYDRSGWTPLLTAAYHGDVEVARELVRANANVHLKVRASGWSVLYTAWVKFYLLVMFILRMGEQAADYYEKTKWSGRTALHIAAYYGHQSLVKLFLVKHFLESNININEQDDKGRTALMLAVERGHSAVVAELVQAGADIGLKDRKGMTAVLLAKSYDMVYKLVWYVDRNRLSREDRSRILWHACDAGDLSMVQSVIEAGCDVDHIHKGQTPVMMATLRGHDGIVKELILANCDVNLHSKGYFSDFISSLKAESLLPVVFFCLELMSGYSDWESETRMDCLIDVPTDSVAKSFVSVLALSGLVVVGVLLVMESGIEMLIGLGVFAIALRFIDVSMLVMGPVISVIVALRILLVVLMVVTSMYRDVSKDFTTFLALCMCAHAVMQFVTVAMCVWSLRDVAMAGAIIVFAIVIVTHMVWKGMMAALHRLVVIVLVGKMANLEIYVILVACIQVARKVFEDVGKVWVIFVSLFMVIPQVTSGTQKTAAEVIIRGAVVLFGFVAATMYKMEDVLVPLESMTVMLVLVVLVMARFVADTGATITKKHILLKGMVVVLHVVVAVAEVYLAVVVSNARTNQQMWAEGLVMYINLIMVLVVLTPIKATGVTALHYAAEHNRVKGGVFLMEAGGDMRAKNGHLYTPFEIGSDAFQTEIKQVLSFTTKRIIAVIGNSGYGKSTLVAALERTSDILWKKAINHFKKVHDIRQRTAGIEAVQVSNQKYGEALFYDFAGQSQYHGPHQSFLEAMLSKPGVTVTMLLLVKATEEENVITEQLYRWLQPLAIMSIPIAAKVVVVGSFLDQVKSEKEASEKLLRCSQSMKTELALDIQGPCLLDCRQPESKGINQICTFLQEAHPVNTKALAHNLHWVLVQVRKAFTIPALQLHEFQTWLQGNARDLPRNLPSPEEVCQDLSAAGHTFFLPNKCKPSQSWLILDLPTLLHKVYGRLFSGCQDRVNEFGLLCCSQLTQLFPKLCPEVIQGVLKSLEFCIEIDPALLERTWLKLHIPVDKGERWLYFPALVSAQTCNIFPEDSDPAQLQWLCWQLRTTEKHFISAHLLQTIILRLAANHVFTHELAPSVKKNCCKVWVNGLSWRSTKGVDIAVQINDSSVVQVVGRSKAGSERLHRYTSTVVRDVIKTTTQLSPKLEATSYIVHPYTPTMWEDSKSVQTDSLYPVLSIIRCISNDDDHVLSLPKEDGDHPQQMSLSEMFGWFPSLPVVQVMDFTDPSSSSAGEWNATHVLPLQLPSALNYQKQPVVVAQTGIGCRSISVILTFNDTFSGQAQRMPFR